MNIPEKIICSNCGALNDGHDSVCSVCGYQLDKGVNDDQ